ncbi:MAG: T9SS type A sorting domain-containing protein [Bacteroidota bacterium]
MKRSYFPISILLTLFMLSVLVLEAQLLSWQYENILTDIQQSGASPDLMIDDAGNLHVSFWIRKEEKLMYARRDKASGQWTYEVVPESGAYGLRSAILIDNNGFVHIAFLRRQDDEAWLHYATNESGSWQSSRIFDSSDLGAYGEGSVFPFYLKHSLDITLQSSGEPLIMFFNGKISNTIPCNDAPGLTSYNQYELNLNVIAKQTDNTWSHNQLPDINFTENFGCLPGVDRFGEFCQIIPGPNDNFYAIGNALHTSSLIWAESASNNLLNWSYQSADSLERVFNTMLTTNTFYEGFDDLVFDQSADGYIHLIYTTSNFYGKLSNNDARKQFFYNRFHPDSIGMAGYSPFYKEVTSRDGYKNHLSLAAKSADSIFLSYQIANSSDVIVSQSTNGGDTWSVDTLLSAPITSKMKMSLYQDSLFLLAYHEDLDFLTLSRRSTQVNNWVTENASLTETRAASFDSEIERSGTDDQIYIAFDEASTGSVNYGERINGVWTYQTVISDIDFIDGLSLARYANGDPVIAFADQGGQSLEIASRVGGSWQINTIQSGGQYRDLQLLEVNGALHLCYYLASEGELRYAFLDNPGGVWTNQLIDNTSLIVGQQPSFKADNNGKLYVAYVDAFNAKLKLANLPVGGSWTFADVTNPQSYIPVFPDVEITQNDEPLIAFRDASSNRIIVANSDGQGGWTFDPVVGDFTNLVGAPLDLLLDDKDRPWILYNYLSASDELRLIRRDGQGLWNQVSVLNNINQIANSFDFHLVDQDFYVLGKQNRPGQNGIGMLYAFDGVNTSLEESLVGGSFRVWPNPSGQSPLWLSFELIKPQEISVAIYNLQGQKLHLIQDTQLLTAGNHQLQWDPASMSPGMYFVVLETAKGRLTQKLVVQP